MMTAVLGLVAAIAAALITRSVMISNHRQAWINALRDDLASFFTAIDVANFAKATQSKARETYELEQQQKARNDALLAYRKILMRLNMNENLHQRLEKSLERLLMGNSAAPQEITEAVMLSRVILKREWEVTKYGPFSVPIMHLKANWIKGQARID
jgi:hypothetical protein